MLKPLSTAERILVLLVIALQADAQPIVRPLGPVVALTHMRLIDGTGSPARNDQTIVVDRGRIVSVGGAATVQAPAGATVLDLRGRTVIPGLVGMHDHLFYQLEPAAAP